MGCILASVCVCRLTKVSFARREHQPSSKFEIELLLLIILHDIVFALCFFREVKALSAGYVSSR